MKKIIIPVALAIFFSGILSASNKILILKPDKTIAMAKSDIMQLGGKIKREFPFINSIAVEFPDYVKDTQISALPTVAKVEEDKYLKWIEEIPTFQSNPLPSAETIIKEIKNNPYDIEMPLSTPTEEEAKEIPWGVKRVNAYGAWDFTTGKGAKVAVIDTGMDYTHPDLKDNYVEGYNAVTQTTDPMDDHGHGTHVAGTIAAIKDLKGVVGVAPQSKLYAVKVLDENGSGQFSWIIDGIQWAVKNKMDVINMSLGGRQGSDALKAAVDAAKESGITVVCAAGNDSGPVNYPAKYDSAIAVSALSTNDKIAYFSSRGPEIDFIAPGVSIYSTYKGGGYKSMSGTSMASPHVAGLAALAVSAGAKTPDEVFEMLKKASSTLNLKPTEEGNGLTDAAKIGK